MKSFSIDLDEKRSDSVQYRSTEEVPFNESSYHSNKNKIERIGSNYSGIFKAESSVFQKGLKFKPIKILIDFILIQKFRAILCLVSIIFSLCTYEFNMNKYSYHEALEYFLMFSSFIFCLVNVALYIWSLKKWDSFQKTLGLINRGTKIFYHNDLISIIFYCISLCL